MAAVGAGGKQQAVSWQQDCMQELELDYCVQIPQFLSLFIETHRFGREGSHPQPYFGRLQNSHLTQSN